MAIWIFCIYKNKFRFLKKNISVELICGSDLDGKPYYVFIVCVSYTGMLNVKSFSVPFFSMFLRINKTLIMLWCLRSCRWDVMLIQGTRATRSWVNDWWEIFSMGDDGRKTKKKDWQISLTNKIEQFRLINERPSNRKTALGLQL